MRWIGVHGRRRWGVRRALAKRSIEARREHDACGAGGEFGERDGFHLNYLDSDRISDCRRGVLRYANRPEKGGRPAWHHERVSPSSRSPRQNKTDANLP